MDTKIFIGIPFDALLKEALQDKEHGLLITIKEKKEFIGLRTTSSSPSFTELVELKKMVSYHLNNLSLPFLLDIEQRLFLFPELLLG